jgi:hypothetical protein
MRNEKFVMLLVLYLFGLSWLICLRRVVDLFVCWWYASSTESFVVWKMRPSCLLWCPSSNIPE